MDRDLGSEQQVTSCAECGSSLAHDQRYCVECGRRRGALPRHVSQMIGGVKERGERVVPGSTLPDEDEPRRFDAWIGAPRAAAVAVLGMLGFGVVVGSLVSGSAASPLAPIIVAFSPSSASQAGANGSGAGGGGGGGGGGGNVTITTTTPAPQSSTNSGSGGGSGSTTTTGTTSSTTLPPIKHVFMVVLDDQGYNETFGHSNNDPYLAKTLVKQGELVVNYYAVAGSPLGNEIAMVSGQGPNPETANDCPTYDSLIAFGQGADNQELGSGCVNPTSAQTIADELTADKLTWKAYLQTKSPQRKAGYEQCHPPLGSSKGSHPTSSQPYAAWRNPFLYFKSLTAAACPKNDVPLSQLSTDLKKTSTTPSLSYIVADVCDDGSPTSCAPGTTAGMGPADTFLKSVIPEIEKSAAYKADGMIAITFDNAPQSGPFADSSSCCNNPTYPNDANGGQPSAQSG
ncbi:MAG TPA: alkaline phosphatase family protein, partial [Solirubrobacteraceae bacterium]|nr:alkaline phosphatase family protein [Solirubrobacteraceae bacterium]